MPARTESRFIEISDNIIFGGSRGEGYGPEEEGRNGGWSNGAGAGELQAVDRQGGRAGRVGRCRLAGAEGGRSEGW